MCENATPYFKSLTKTVYVPDFAIDEILTSSFATDVEYRLGVKHYFKRFIKNFRDMLSKFKIL